MTAPTATARRPTTPARLRALGRAAWLLGGAVAFWWATTGVLLALERSATTRLLSLGIALAAAAGGLVLTARVRREAPTAGAAARAVLAGALLWTCVSAAFYGGWVVGPATADGPGGAGAVATAARAVAALRATAYATLLAAALLASCRTLARWRGGAPRSAAGFAPATLAVLWAAHELAKLNVFLGVANPGAEYLPAYLNTIRDYFGPARNSPLLWPSVALLVAAAAGVGRSSARAVDVARRTGLALIATVLALAALEHALLGVQNPVGWWDAFLRWRGGA